MSAPSKTRRGDQEEVDAPGLHGVVGISDFGSSHDHCCQCAVDGARAGHLARPAGDLVGVRYELRGINGEERRLLTTSIRVPSLRRKDGRCIIQPSSCWHAAA